MYSLSQMLHLPSLHFAQGSGHESHEQYFVIFDNNPVLKYQAHLHNRVHLTATTRPNSKTEFIKFKDRGIFMKDNIQYGSDGSLLSS